MDKFVVKQKRDLPRNRSKSEKPKKLSQSTLQSLAGVVVIKDFEEAKVVLEDDSEDLEKKIQVLQKLLVKNPSKEVLIRVGIGKTVNRLRKYKTEDSEEDSQIIKLRKLSEKVYKKWRSELERKEDLKASVVEVKCDQVK